MILAELDKMLVLVETSFAEKMERLEPLAKSLVQPPSLFLTRLLLGSLALGSTPPDDRAICAGRALEFLDQALALSTSVCSESGYDEAKLLVTDYFYGQAIDQVIGTGEAQIIGILATAITASAEDKINEADNNYQTRLIAAALDIALVLGDFDSTTLAAVKAAKAAAVCGELDWPASLQIGQAGEFIQRSITPEANNQCA